MAAHEVQLDPTRSSYSVVSPKPAISFVSRVARVAPSRHGRWELTAGAEDLVGVVGGHSWVDQRVKTSLSSDATALHAPKGSRVAPEKGGRSVEGKELLGVHDGFFALNAIESSGE